MDKERIRELSEALIVAERRRQETQHLSGVDFWELDHQNQTLYWSEEIYAIYELNSDIVSPNYEIFLSLIYEGNRNLVHKTYQDSVTFKTEYCLWYRIKAGGSVKWIEAKGVTLYDGQGMAERAIQDTELEQELDNWVIETVLGQSKIFHRRGIDGPFRVKGMASLTRWSGVIELIWVTHASAK